MLKELYIHIGTPKTGSSAITSYLNANVDNLKKQNTTYLENINNGEVLFPLWGDDSEERTKSINKILEACLECKTEKGILASETLSLALENKDCKEALLFIFKELALKGIKIKISAVIRTPDEYLLAAYKEDVTSGLCPLSFFAWLKTDQGAEHSNIIQNTLKWEMKDLLGLAIYQFDENKKNIEFTKHIFEKSFGLDTRYFDNQLGRTSVRVSFDVNHVEAIRRMNARKIHDWNRPIWKNDLRHIYERLFRRNTNSFERKPDLSLFMRYKLWDIISLNSCLNKMLYQYEQVSWSGNHRTKESNKFKGILKKMLLGLEYQNESVALIIQDMIADSEFQEHYYAKPSPGIIDSMNHRIFLRREGFCPICEKEKVFVARESWLRDHYFCEGCGSIPRERAIMNVIQTYYPKWRDLDIHESSPGNRGASVKMREQCTKYIETQYDLEVKFGNTHPTNGYRSEDLENQTFANNSFDLVVTQDVMEHVFNPENVFREIHRTLKNGGAHIFTTPIIRKESPSLCRAEMLKDGSISHIYPPEYHGNPVSKEGSLVTWHWGNDIKQIAANATGSKVEIVACHDEKMGIEGEYLEVIVQKKI